MIRVVYCSHGALGTPANAMVRDILMVSRRNNRRDGVTGALLIAGASIAQCLEGPATAVARTLERIGRDPRHSGIVVLSKAPVANRLFADWSMALSLRGEGGDKAAVAVFARAFAEPGEAQGADLLRLIRDGISGAQFW